MIKKLKLYFRKDKVLKLSIVLCLVIALVFFLYIINNLIKLSELFIDINSSSSSAGEEDDSFNMLNLLEFIREVPIIGAMFVYFFFTLIPIPVSVQYLVSKYKKTIAVYKFLGYNEISIFFKVLKPCFVAILFVALVSNLIYLFLERLWFNNIVSFFGTYNLTFLQYIVIDLFFALTIFIFLMPIVGQIKEMKVEYNDE